MGPLEVIVVLILLTPVVTVGWLIYRAFNRKSRPCPRCGNRVKNGFTICQKCDFDFMTIGADEIPEH
jgi:hypothetical protein